MPSSLQASGPSALQAFSHSSYTLVRPRLSWRRIYRVFAPDGSLSAIVEQPWFRLRTELTVYADDETTRPILVLKNRRSAAVNTEHSLYEAATAHPPSSLPTRAL